MREGTESTHLPIRKGITMLGKWLTLLDDYGLKEMRQVGPRAFQFIEITDMVEACGRDNEGRPQYVAELSLVDLAVVPLHDIKAARESCGWEGAPDTDVALAEMVHSYGVRGMLGSWEGNGRTVVRRLARSEAHTLAMDSEAMEAKLETPVNRLGTTAREAMAGDIDSAMVRGVEAGRPDARLMAKMYGADQWMIDDARPADFLPYLMGYMSGVQGGSKEESDPANPISPEYFRGYERGERVKRGECPAPGWIKTAKTA